MSCKLCLSVKSIERTVTIAKSVFQVKENMFVYVRDSFQSATTPIKLLKIFSGQAFLAVFRRDKTVLGQYFGSKSYQS